MELKDYFNTLLDELFQEYEQYASVKMYFTLELFKGHLIFTDISNILLQTLHHKRDNLIGTTIESVHYLGDANNHHRIKNMYSLALEGKHVFFYCVPDKNPNIVLLIFLKPKYTNNKVDKIIGHCIDFNIDELQKTIRKTDLFLAFKL